VRLKDIVFSKKVGLC